MNLLRKTRLILGIILALILLSACQFSDKVVDSPYESDELKEVANIQEEIEEVVCEIEKIEKEVDGNSMVPLIQNGARVILLQNYYRCGNPVEVGDFVAYSFAGEKHPLIKVIQATSADEVEIKANNLYINGAILKNSAGTLYTFSESESNMLNIYIRNKHIPQNSYFVFGDNTGISTDSRKFGAVSAEDFLGKFEIN